MDEQECYYEFMLYTSGNRRPRITIQRERHGVIIREGTEEYITGNRVMCKHSDLVPETEIPFSRGKGGRSLKEI